MQDKKQYNKEYRIKNIEKIKIKKKESYLKNREQILLKQKQYRLDNIEEILIRAKKNRANNKEKKREIDRLYRLKNFEKIKINKKLYHQKVKNTEAYKEKRRASQKIYNQTPERKEWNRLHAKKNYQKNKDRQNIYWINNPESLQRRESWKKTYMRTYRKKNRLDILLQLKTRRENDPNFKIRQTLRSRIWTVLKRKNKSKSATTLTLLGVDNVETVISHIEKQFKPWMTWDNHGDWHLDHIMPCASFDLTCPVQQLACLNYKNLQPMEAFENMRKGAKILHG